MKNSSLNYKFDCTQDLSAITSWPQTASNSPAEEAWHKRAKEERSYTSTEAVNSIRLIKRWHLEACRTITPICIAPLMHQLYSAYCTCMRCAFPISSGRWIDIANIILRGVFIFSCLWTRVVWTCPVSGHEEQQHKRPKSSFCSRPPPFF